MRLRVLVAVALAARAGSGQAVTPLSCEAVVPPSDSGAGRFGRVAEGPAGRLAWTDGRSAEILLRDRVGKVRTIGRQGGGPGEFERVGGLGWLGDTLWASDARVPRVTFFSDTGRLLRVATATPQVDWIPRPDGRLVGFGWTALGGPTLPPYLVFAQLPGALRRDTLKVFPSPPVEHYKLPPQGALNAQPFSFRTSASPSRSGSRFCSARPDGEATRVECIDDRGSSVLNVSMRLDARPLTDAVYDSMIALFARGRGRTEQVMRDLIKRPRNLPAVMSMMIDPSETIWLQRSHSSEPMAYWTRLRPDGSVRDNLAFPRRYRILSPQENGFWAAQADNDGLETLYRCRLQ